MPLRDLSINMAVVNLLDAQDITNHTDAASKILDTNGFDGAAIAVHVGALTGADAANYITPVLQESDTVADADFTAVAAGDIGGGFTKIDAANEDQTVQVASYKGTKRYIRALIDFTDAGVTSALLSVSGILALAANRPAVGPAPITATV